MRIVVVSTAILVAFTLACGGDLAEEEEPATTTAPAPAPSVPSSSGPLWEVFPPPAGAERLEADPFATWIGALNVKAPDVPVRTHDGRVVRGHPGARVIDLPMVPGDLQQCADAAIRVRAEWLEETGGEILYHATSGDPIPWTRWQAGERPYEKDGGLAWRPGTGGGWEAYLTAVMVWAGTWSVATYDTVPAEDPRAGDLLVEGGFPGHAVMLLDVAKRDEETFVLIGESFMPAMDFHVEPGPVEGWWSWEEGVRLAHWDLREAPLRRWKR